MNVDWLITKIRQSEQHKCLYHFTDAANIPSIDEKGLLCKKRMKQEGRWPPRVTGGNELSDQLDSHRGLDPYVSLCMTDNHPMQFRAMEGGRLSNPIYLKIDPEFQRRLQAAEKIEVLVPGAVPRKLITGAC